MKINDNKKSFNSYIYHMIDLDEMLNSNLRSLVELNNQSNSMMKHRKKQFKVINKIKSWH